MGDNFFGDMFDFDGDGKTDLGEEFLAFKMFEEAMKEDDDDDLDDLSFDDDGDLSDDDDDADIYRSAPRFSGAPATAKPAPEPEPEAEQITWEDYREQRRAYCKEAWKSIWQMLLLTFIPAAVIYAAISVYDGKSVISALVTLVFAGGGLVVIGAVWFSYLSDLAKNWQRLKGAKDSCMENAPQDERKAQRRKKSVRAVCVLLILATVGIGAVALFAASSAKTASTYEEAETLIAAGKYREAEELLTTIKDRNYRDTEALLCLCQAHTDYDRGRVIDAYYDLLGVTFRYQTAERMSEITSFWAVLQNEQDAYWRQKTEQNAAPQETQKATTAPSSGTRTQSRTGGGSWSDDYDVGKYSDPDEFYYWHWDDFIDYEEAEDYYYSHGD